MSNTPHPPRYYQQRGYILISLILAIPILLWPILWQLGFSPEFHAKPLFNWNIAASSLLFAAVVADSILSSAHSYKQLLSHMLWIVLASILISLTAKMSSGSYTIALLFALHSLRSGIPIWCDKPSWWHKPAWIRDTVCAALMFYWLTHWPIT